MNILDETSKRLKIAKNIASPLRGIAKGVFLGGSMGYGQDYSITCESDIDLVVISDINKTNLLAKTKYFEEDIPLNILRMYNDKTIDVFWVVKNIDNIPVNVFVYETQAYSDFCLLNRKFTGYSETKPVKIQKNYDFEGKLLTFDRDVKSCGKGFIYSKPPLVNGKFCGVYPTMDFIESGEILYEEKGFLTSLKDRVWKRLVRQLIEEHGEEVNLDKINILNSHWIYQTRREKFPPSVVEKIKQRTKKELEDYLGKII